MIKRQALLITKQLINQGTQIVITRITYDALIAKKQNIHENDVGSSMASYQHLAKNGVTMEGSKGLMGKHTYLLYNQLKRDT